MSLCCYFSYVVPAVVALLLGWIAYQAFKLYQSLQITGKPNEWVVVINDNKQKIAGIGL